MTQSKVAPQTEERSIESSLRTLYELQRVDTQIAQIVKLRGELPEEVCDLEDEIEGLRTRVVKLENEADEQSQLINEKRHEIKSAEIQIEGYTEKQRDIRNSREFDAMNKEIAFQQLEIALRNKQIKEIKGKIDELKERIKATREVLQGREHDLAAKRSELAGIIADTEKEQAELEKQSAALQAELPQRLLVAYTRICSKVRNGLAVVAIERGACGGCFNRIPPQRQLDIRAHKRVIVCEYCGRIIVDDPKISEAEAVEAEESASSKKS